MVELGLDFMDQGDKNTRKQDKPKTTSVKINIKWPPPYNRFGGGFNQSDVAGYFSQLSIISKVLCNSETSIHYQNEPMEAWLLRVHIQEGEDETLIKDNYGTGKEHRRALEQLNEKRETFLHFTLLSYLGYVKSMKKETEKAGEAIPQPVEDAIKMTTLLTFKTAVEAVKKYNPGLIETEEDFRRRVRQQTTDFISYEIINNISNLFAEAYPNSDKRKEYFNMIRPDTMIGLMHMGKFLDLLEEKTGLRNSVSNIPNFALKLDLERKKSD